MEVDLYTLLHGHDSAIRLIRKASKQTTLGNTTRSLLTLVAR
jgi:hypothetical protein